MAILRLRPRIWYSYFSRKIKAFLREQLTSEYLSTEKLFMDKKMEEIDFSTLATQWSIFPDRRLKKVADLN